CDDGTEIVSPALDLWAYTHGVVLDFRRRGKPTDNAAIESFNGRFREECLNIHWFASPEDAQQKIDAFRSDYNENHPRRALKGLSPREYVQGPLATAADSPSSFSGQVRRAATTLIINRCGRGLVFPRVHDLPALLLDPFQRKELARGCRAELFFEFA